jgi:hypothetical protein
MEKVKKAVDKAFDAILIDDSETATPKYRAIYFAVRVAKFMAMDEVPGHILDKELKLLGEFVNGAREEKARNP